MISFALGELGIKDYDYLYEMTMSEFNIRFFSYIRQQKERQFLFREVAWASLIGSHSNPKKLPKTKERFWSIFEDTEKKDFTEQVNALKKAIENYNNGRN